METFVYVIFDNETYEVFEVFRRENECIEKFKSHYDGFVNVDWRGLNIKIILGEILHG